MSLSELEIRKLYIDDNQWNRTNKSWKNLKPCKNFNYSDESDESVFDYCQRVKKVLTVPVEVAEQWLFCHYYNTSTIDNYGWINYEKATFVSETITPAQAIKLRVIKEYSTYVNSRMYCKPFEDFMCIPEDKEYWIHEGTWRVPPVIVDVQSFNNYNPPPYADFSGILQLVEGHARLGYLLSMQHHGNATSGLHHVYILRSQRNV